MKKIFVFIMLLATFDVNATPCTKFSPVANQIPASQTIPENVSGGWWIAYYDAQDNLQFVFDATTCYNSNVYTITQESLIPTGCSADAIIRYKTCTLVEQSDEGYCDNDYYYLNGNCVECPKIANMYNDQGSLVTNASSGCGIGNEAGFYKDITTCHIYATAGDDRCTYCDSIGCFIYNTDCYYTE